MRLHRYFASHADTTLIEKRLLLSKVSTFNDPFEFAHRFKGEYTFAQAKKDIAELPEERFRYFFKSIPSFERSESSIEWLAEQFVKAGGRPLFDPKHNHKLVDEHFRACCFSRTDTTPGAEILLWSHYAKNHHGVRIEFELNEKQLPLHEVTYSQARPAIDFINEADSSHTRKVLMEAMQTKALPWEYENEVRLIISKKATAIKPIPLGYLHYLPFAPSCVKSVDFGINCDAETEEAVRSIIKSDYPHAIARKAIHHADEYAIEYKPI